MSNAATGRERFARFLMENGISQKEAAEALGRSSASVNGWLHREIDPDWQSRRVIERWTSGSRARIPAEAWETDRERDDVARVVPHAAMAKGSVERRRAPARRQAAAKRVMRARARPSGRTVQRARAPRSWHR